MEFSSRCSALWSGACLLGLVGCTGVLDGSEPSANAAGPEGSAGTTSAGGGASTAADCATAAVPVLHARLLTPSQYDHAVEDLLKVGDHPAKDFGGGVAARLDEVAVEQRADAAASIAARASASLGMWAPCSPPAVEAVACGAQLVDKLGPAAYRHPLSVDERAQLQALFDAGLAEKDFATGVEWLLTGLLQTPDFLYQFARPGNGESAGQVVALPPYELASRLSFFVWDSAPDETLYVAAAENRLGDAAAVATELQRMFLDPRFARGVASFYSSWLGLEGFREVARDEPALTSEVLDLLEHSLLLSATELYASGSPTLSQLLSGQSYYLNDELRAFYGLGGGGPELQLTELPNQGRHGILTHPGLMTLLARPNASDPIARGLFLQRTLLCNEIPPPPQGVVIPPLAPAAEGLSTRQRLERHTTEPLCQGCHGHIDPPGFALENFDAVGRFRTQDAGVPVDSSGNLSNGSDLDGAFASGAELLERIAQSADARHCFAEHYLSFALSRALLPEDECSLSRVASGFASSGDLKRLIVTVAQSDSFRLRAAESPEGAP
jgi:hypothetical protein